MHLGRAADHVGAFGRFGIVVAFVGLVCLNPTEAAALCGDNVASGAEQCDDGGVCIGGPLAGSACSSEAQCVTGGACFGGLDDLGACDSDDDCRMGTCRRCRPVGGDGCAANCTFETDIAFDLVDGIIAGVNTIKFGTSGAIEFSGIVDVPLLLSGSVRLTAGRSVGGQTPITIRAGGIELQPVPVSIIACACVRLPTPSTCGGTLTDLGGGPSSNCTPGFPGEAACPVDRPCAPLHGAGNAGSGFIGCGAPSLDVDLLHDCNATPGAEPLAPVTTVSIGEPGRPGEASAFLALALAIGTTGGECSGDSAERGADGEFCTADDPIEKRGIPSSSRFTTGSAEGLIVNAVDFEDILGPFAVDGRAFTCRADGSVDVSQGIITTAFSICDQPTTSDVVVPTSLAFAAAPALPPPAALPCDGDCDGFGTVTVDEIITLVSVALGTGTLQQCAVGDRDGDTELTVDEVVTALTHALQGCDPGPVEYPCGNRRLDGAEHCDDGGACIGGPLAGTSCRSEQECVSGGACFGGLNDLRACDSADDCRGGACRRCRPVGGDGCAANCTVETQISKPLVPGILDETRIRIAPGTSGMEIAGPVVDFVAPMSGTATMVIGDVVDNVTPVVIRAGAVDIDPFRINAWCYCLRFPEMSTCGGTSFELDGTPSLDCSAASPPAICPADRPCATVHGAGNSGSGFIECGVEGTGVAITQDCNAKPGGLPLPPLTTGSYSSAARLKAGHLMLTLSPALGNVIGACSGTSAEYGIDGQFCTVDDPTPFRGMPVSLPFTSAAASGTIVNPGDFEDVLGPVTVEGAPFVCAPGGAVNIGRGGGIAAASTACDLPTITDVVSPMTLFFAPDPTFTPTPSATVSLTPTRSRRPSPTRTPIVQ